MDAVFIDASREAYSPKGAMPTMTVGELMQILEDLDPEAPVFIRNDSGYTYGSLDDRDISSANIDQTEE